MPISNLFHAGTVIHFATTVPNDRVLDVGVGSGTYGFLLRQFIEATEERWHQTNWQATIEGIEVFEPYRNEIWDYAYDTVHVGDIRTVIDTVGKFDVVVACDVLEHFPRDEARSIINRLQSHAGVLIATTPNREFVQGAWGGNEAERHHSLLDESDFPDLVTSKVTGVTTCYVSARDPFLRERIAAAAKMCPDVLSPKLPRLRRARTMAGRLLRAAGLRKVKS